MSVYLYGNDLNNWPNNATKLYTTVALFVQNLPILGDNKRYSYSSGFKNSYPDKVSWIEEPTVVGVSYNMKF